MTTPAEPAPPYKSILADHLDIKDILPIFIQRLPRHVQRLRQLHAAGNTEELRRFAHQLRGSGKSYGFPSLTTHAATLEDILLASAPNEQIEPALRQLVAYIEQIDGYAPT